MYNGDKFDMNNKQILYISYDGMTDPLGQSQVLPYIVGLSKFGYVFTLISCEKPDRYHNNRSIIEKICTDHQIDWSPLMYHKSPPILSTLWDVNQIQKLAYRLQEQKSYAMVHCRGYISALIGLGLKRRYGAKFLFDMRGLWADEKVDAGAWRLENPIYKFVYKFFKKKEREFFLNADYSVSLTEKGKKEILSWDYMQGQMDNIEVIPCCADMELFDCNKLEQQKIQDLKSKLRISDTDLVISYLGSIGTWYMLEEMLDFFGVLKSRWTEAKFLFVTFDEHDRIRIESQKRGLWNNIIIHPAARSEVPSVLSLSTWSIFFIRPTYSKLSSSPTKQAEIMAMGIPIICNEGIGDTDKIIEQYEAGILVRGLETNGYNSALDHLKIENYNAQKIREGAVEYFSLEKGVNLYQSIYKKLSISNSEDHKR